MAIAEKCRPPQEWYDEDFDDLFGPDDESLEPVIRSREGRATVDQADGRSTGRKSSYHRWLKRAKARRERHKAKRNPECLAAYGRYRGYET